MRLVEGGEEGAIMILATQGKYDNRSALRCTSHCHNYPWVAKIEACNIQACISFQTRALLSLKVSYLFRTISWKVSLLGLK